MTPHTHERNSCGDIQRKQCHATGLGGTRGLDSDYIWR